MTLREKIAAQAHESWSGWMRYLFGKCDKMCDGEGNVIGLLIPQELVDRWVRQLGTPYGQLPENERESDRVEADRYLALIELELSQLRKDSAKLAALEGAGVDNWEGYDEAMQSLREEAK